MHEKVIFERLFDRGGYVLNFSDNTFAEFFREHAIDINNQKYYFNGNSKMKRLRAFWELEDNLIVGNILNSLLEYAAAIEDIPDEDFSKAKIIINRLQGKKVVEVSTKKDFLEQEFDFINLDKLKLDSQFHAVMEQRLKEIKITLAAKAALATIFLCGSTLEGLLHDRATSMAQQFNIAKSAPKDQTGKVKKIHEWSLESLINTAHEIRLISLDVKKYSHALKDFRNFIHPRQQSLCQFNPDMHTAKISWQVLQAAIANLMGIR